MSQKLSFIVFLSTICLILAAGCFYLAQRLFWTIPFLQTKKAYVYLTLFLFILLQLLGPLWYRLSPLSQERSFILQWLTYISLGFIASLFFYLLGTEILLFLAKKIPALNSSSESFDNLERRLFLGVGLISLASAALGTQTALKGPLVEEVTVPLKNLPPEFEGFTIAQISDLHVGPTIQKDYAQQVVQRTQDLKADIIVLTGDLIDGHPDQLRPHLAPLQSLNAPLGVFYCTGNHEYYWGGESWCREFSEMGFTVLLNDHRILQRGSSSLCIGGITDLKAHQFLESHRSDANKAFKGVPTETLKVLLAHQPASYRQALEAGVHLQLSGHTHGGQFFPWSLLVAAAQKFYRGLYYHEGLWVYTNRGTGYWGPPQRFMVPPEITHIRLTKATS